jgi:hypothetical protein
MQPAVAAESAARHGLHALEGERGLERDLERRLAPLAANRRHGTPFLDQVFVPTEGDVETSLRRAAGSTFEIRWTGNQG